MTHVGEQPRSARGEATRRRIVTTASRLFSERGQRAVSLRDVAAATGLSQPGVLRHFTSRDQLLAAVLAHHLDEPRPSSRVATGLEPHLAEPRDSERELLLTAIAGEATSSHHPAHALMRDRYATDRAELRSALIAAATSGDFGAGRDPGASARELIAARDGLRIMRAYLGGRVDAARALRTRRTAMRAPYGVHDTGFPAPRRRSGTASFGFAPHTEYGEIDSAGYAVGRARRQQILDQAIALFSRVGYAETSLREVAESAGVSKSALLHHFPTKEQLLHAVLQERDRRTVADVSKMSHESSRAGLLSVPRGARENAELSHGLIELYAVLSCEAMPADHAAHQYFANRYTRAVATLEAAFLNAADDGELPLDVDPSDAALWLVALWDGLQIQAAYDSSVDVADDLDTYLRDILPGRS